MRLGEPLPTWSASDDGRDLLTTLRGRGLIVATDGDALIVRPRDLLTDELWVEIRAPKCDLLSELPRHRWRVIGAGRRRKGSLLPARDDRERVPTLSSRCGRLITEGLRTRVERRDHERLQPGILNHSRLSGVRAPERPCAFLPQASGSGTCRDPSPDGKPRDDLGDDGTRICSAKATNSLEAAIGAPRRSRSVYHATLG